MPQIICRDLSLGYNGHVISQHLTFEVNRGEYLCIVGENGSGKSTLVRTLLGLQPPMKGAILFGDGVQQRDIGYLPQQTEIQRDFPATVEEIVRSGCSGRSRFSPFYTKADRVEAVTNMKIMGILPLAGKAFCSLSGGQQQRVLLARALCAAGQILLLDEPVAGLDPNATEELYDTVRHLKCHLGLTVVAVTHDLASLRDADRVLHMKAEPVFYRDPAEYLKSLDGAEGRGKI